MKTRRSIDKKDLVAEASEEPESGSETHSSEAVVGESNQRGDGGASSADAKKSSRDVGQAAAMANTPKHPSSSNNMKGATTGNPLSKIRPGYLAPLHLSAPSLDKFKCEGGLESLRKASMKQDYKAAFSARAGVGSVRTPGFKNKSLQQLGMMDPSTDSTLAQDVHLIRHRNYMDPKRFYKNPDLPGKWVQRGTYVEDGKRVRQGTLVDQVLGAKQDTAYVKRKYQTMQRTQQEKAQKRSKRKFKR